MNTGNQSGGLLLQNRQSCGLSLRSGTNLARGECFFANPWNPSLRDQSAPAAAGARGGPATPAGVRIVVPPLPRGSLRSPPANFLSPRWGGIRYRIHEIMYLVWSLSRLKPELHVSPRAIRFGVFWPPGRLTLG